MDNTQNDENKPVALLLGGTGLIGGILLRKILQSGEYSKVIAITRKKIPLAHSHLENIINDMKDIESTVSELKIDDVFCCLGTTMKKAGTEERFRFVDYEIPFKAARACQHNGVRHFLVVSAIGANKDSPFFYNRVKGQLEFDLKNLGLPFLTIFQPSLLLGDRDESRFLEKVSGSVFSVFKPLMVGKLANIAPIDAETVAESMMNESLNVINNQREAGVVTLESSSIANG